MGGFDLFIESNLRDGMLPCTVLSLREGWQRYPFAGFGIGDVSSGAATSGSPAGGLQPLTKPKKIKRTARHPLPPCYLKSGTGKLNEIRVDMPK